MLVIHGRRYAWFKTKLNTQIWTSTLYGPTRQPSKFITLAPGSIVPGPKSTIEFSTNIENVLYESPVVEE
jgi:hypothetical protein